MIKHKLLVSLQPKAAIEVTVVKHRLDDNERQEHVR
jgi:hypothetical protein